MDLWRSLPSPLHGLCESFPLFFPRPPNSIHVAWRLHPFFSRGFATSHLQAVCPLLSTCGSVPWVYLGRLIIPAACFSLYLLRPQVLRVFLLPGSSAVWALAVVRLPFPLLASCSPGGLGLGLIGAHSSPLPTVLGAPRLLSLSAARLSLVFSAPWSLSRWPPCAYALPPTFTPISLTAAAPLRSCFPAFVACCFFPSFLSPAFSVCRSGLFRAFLLLGSTS